VEFLDRCTVFCFPRFSESIDRQVPVDGLTHYSIVPKVFYTCNLSAEALGDGPTPKALTQLLFQVLEWPNTTTDSSIRLFPEVNDIISAWSKS